uniref:Uncharacterized protein n=2 Tax=unclassified Caudoviricetes TaxID=2788787 RepID=A0A8S5Q898_9CAUD|nr:MAG TPA: hypothetical protein [Siphoviridae sp. ctAvK3]DAE15154.1 MAG TPA: hypothetical protein [Siphoviridae sp. ctdVv30]
MTQQQRYMQHCSSDVSLHPYCNLITAQSYHMSSGQERHKKSAVMYGAICDHISKDKNSRVTVTACATIHGQTLLRTARAYSMAG